MVEITVTPDQLAPLAGVSASAEMMAWEPDGPTGKVNIKRLLGRLISTSEATATQAELQALLNYDANATALVFADPDFAKCGWYRKTGSAGAGAWVLFEGLSAAAQQQAAAAATLATAKAAEIEAALPAVNTQLAGLSDRAATLEGHAATDEATLANHTSQLGGHAQELARHTDELADHETRLADQKASIDGVGTTTSPWPRGAHRAWRLKVGTTTSSFGDTRAREIEFRATPGGAAMSGGVAFGSPSSFQPANYVPAKAFDGTSAFWIGDSALPQYIGMVYPSPVSVNEFVWAADLGGKAGKTIALQYSDDTTDGSDGTWADAWAPADQTGWADYETRVFTDPVFGHGSRRAVLVDTGTGSYSYRDPTGASKPLFLGDGSGSGSGKSANTQALIAAVARGQIAQPGYRIAAADVPTFMLGADDTTHISASTHIGPADPRFAYPLGLSVPGSASYPGDQYRHSLGGFYGFNADGVTPYRASSFFAAEFVHTGSRFELCLFSGGAKAPRLVVNGVAIAAPNPANDGAFRRLLVTFPTTGSRIISWETDNFGFCGLAVASDGEVTALPFSRPVVPIIGDSFTEGAGEGVGVCQATAPTLARALGVAGYVTGVGGTGLISPGGGNLGGGGKVNWLDPMRLQDLTLAGTGVTPAAGIVLMSLNDPGPMSAWQAYGATALEAMHKATHLLIDGWVAANPGKPLIVASNMVPAGPPEYATPVSQWDVFDGIQAACGERRADGVYFVDRLSGNPLRQGMSTNPGEQASLLTSSDGTHPTGRGHIHDGLWLADRVRGVILSEIP